MRDVVAVAVPTGTGSALVVLTRPSVGVAHVSPTVHPTREGLVHRDWSPLPMQSGIALVHSTQEAGPALRVRCAGYDGPVAGAADPRVTTRRPAGSIGYPQEARRYVAAATGLAPDVLSTDVLLHARGPSVLDLTPRVGGRAGRVRKASPQRAHSHGTASTRPV